MVGAEVDSEERSGYTLLSEARLQKRRRELPRMLARVSKYECGAATTSFLQSRMKRLRAEATRRLEHMSLAPRVATFCGHSQMSGYVLPAPVICESGAFFSVHNALSNGRPDTKCPSRAVDAPPRAACDAREHTLELKSCISSPPKRSQLTKGEGSKHTAACDHRIETLESPQHATTERVVSHEKSSRGVARQLFADLDTALATRELRNDARSTSFDPFAEAEVGDGGLPDLQDICAFVRADIAKKQGLPSPDVEG